MKKIVHDFENAITQNNYFELQRVRTPIWNYVKLACLSFIRMNCDAQISKIFQSTSFAPQNPDIETSDKKLFFSKFKSAGFCWNCRKPITINSEVRLNYFSIHDFPAVFKNVTEMWSNAILTNNCPNMIQWMDCENAYRVISTDVKTSNFLFFELSLS